MSNQELTRDDLIRRGILRPTAASAPVERGPVFTEIETLCTIQTGQERALSVVRVRGEHKEFVEVRETITSSGRTHYVRFPTFAVAAVQKALARLAEKA